MDDSERLVLNYLKNAGFMDICYEPDGNVPPDFLIDGRVAVEVRRLNQSHVDDNAQGPRGLEEVAIPLARRIREYLISLGQSKDPGPCWYVSYQFSRPVPPWKTLKVMLDAHLRPFMSDPNACSFRTNLSESFSIRVTRGSIFRPTFFQLGGYSDWQSGGWLIDEIDKNLNACIREKSNKISKYFQKYPEWWLIFSDHIGYGLDGFDQDLFFDQVKVDAGSFSKIVTIDPRDYLRSFQIFPR